MFYAVNEIQAEENYVRIKCYAFDRMQSVSVRFMQVRICKELCRRQPVTEEMNKVTFIKNTIVKITIFWCHIVILLFSQYSVAGLMKGNILDCLKMAEVKAFVKELYEAQTNRDVYWIRERLDDDDVMNWAVMLSILYSDDFSFQRYDNIEVKVYATSSEDYLVAVVAYDMIIEWNGEELALPGYESSIVWQNENSQWCITYENGMPDEIVDEVYQLMISDELADWFNSISAEYYDILTCRPELDIWLSELWLNKVQWVVSETFVKNDTWDENDVWDYLFGEENGILTASSNEEENGALTTSFNGEEDSIYVVQEGDCLWNIAEREFGGGMHWVKLYEVNRDTIGENPDLLLVGTELDLVYE